MRSGLLVALTITSLFLGACSTASPHGTGHHGAAQAITDSQARAVPAYRGDGTPATWQDLVTAAAAADFVIVGENHGHPLGLASAAALWKDLLAAAPKSVLAMEFFERHEQALLDDYLSGITDESGLKTALKRDDSSFPPGHQSMVKAAKEASRPVIAANAPRRYVRLARAEGFDRLKGLGPEQRRLFRVPDSVPTGKYREAFEKVMNENSDIKPEQLSDPAFAEERRKTLDATFNSQSVWDWTMSESVANGLEKGKPVLLVVGRFHCDHEGGLVQALRLQRPGVKVLVVSFVDAAAPQDQKLPEADKSRGDFVIYAGTGES